MLRAASSHLAAAATLTAVLVATAFACSPVIVDPCFDCGEGEGEGEGEGGAVAPSVDRICAHYVQCGFVEDTASCEADAARNVEPFATCPGFPDAYAALVACQDDAPCEDDGACADLQTTMNTLLKDCVTPPAVDDALDRVCARYDECAGPDPSCADLYAERFVAAGPTCTEAHAAIADVADCVEAATCESIIDCDPVWSAFYDALFICSAGPAPAGQPFPEGRAYLHELVPADQCNPEMGNCNQTADFCPDGIVNYVVTDILLPGLYAQQGDVVTMSLSETGGETSDLVTFTVQDDGARLVRDDDGAVFVRQEGEPFCE